jgi:ADP-ribose pyrophosphatase YjhB (NUDIX family)
MTRRTRYQGAILRDGHILLLRHREHQGGRAYWVLPGGGIEPGEEEEACVAREMKEETGLDVRVERLLVAGEGFEGSVYQAYKTYLCTPLAGEARPGYEPEPEAAALYSIDALGWVDLRRPSSWDPEVVSDAWTHAQLLRLCEALGY